ncbi:MAG: RNA polymerase sigma factor [Bacteroidetes bacterium]|nr:RNA polymerase sigma factor [Bacteroidota bacterium]
MPNNEIHLKFILEGCRQGNRNSQRKLYEHFYGYGMSLCLRYAKNREEAVEILNDAFLKTFSNLDKYDPAFAFKPWLRRILIHTAIDYHRAYHKFPPHSDLESAAELANDEVPLLSEDEDAMPLVQALPPAYRVVFNLFVMEECSHYEIAEMLGISVSTSRSNLARAKEKLRGMVLKKSLRAVYKKI